MKENKQLTFIDWFAGIGGFRKGLEEVGFKCVGYCEFDKFANASYRSMHTITEEQRKYLAKLKLKDRQKEILKEEYLNGEWFANDITTVDAENIPRADIWCFGAPCQSFSIAGNREGLDGKSGLISEIFRLLRETREEDRPEWLFYENVKGMFSSNKGFDFLAILSEMDRYGYDIEWQLLNSKYWIPQNRERVYTIGHFRNGRSAKVLPIERANGENYFSKVKQVGRVTGTNRDNPNQYRVYDPSGLCPTLNQMGGGGREPHIITVANYRSGGERSRILDQNGISNALSSTDYKQPISVMLSLSEI